MSKNYRVEVLPRVYNDYLEMLKEDTIEGLPSNPSSFFSGLSTGAFKGLGICEYVINHDVLALKQYFYNSVVAAQRVLELYDADNGLKVTIGVSMMNFWSLYQGIISGNIDAVKSFAKLMGGRDVMEKKRTTIHVYNLGYALKYIVLDDQEKAREFIDEIHRNSSDEYNYGLYEILDGILTQNVESLMTGLEMRLQQHKKSNEFKNCPDEFLSIEVLALTKLAKMKGIDVQIESELAPMEIINDIETEYDLLKIMTFEY